MSDHEFVLSAAIRVFGPIASVLLILHLIWRWDGGRVRTWRRFDGMDRLLRIVAERAPDARLLL